MDPLGGGTWGGVVAPLGSAYVGFLVMLAVYARTGGRRRRAPGPSPGWSALLRHLAATTAAGFLIFLAIVLVFSYMFADQSRALREAVAGGGFIAAVGLLGLAVLGWLEAKVRGWRAGRPG